MSTNSHESDMRERPLGEVARDLTRDLSLLVRQEVELAKAEMAQKGRIAAPGLGMIGGAGVVGLMAAGALTAFLILVLSIFLPEWASALIVGAVLAAIAYVLVKQGKERVEEAGAPVPEQTIETLKEDVEWAKTLSDIRAEIEETRSRVGDEVDALSYKTDVSARVGDYVDEKKQAVKDKVTGARDAVTGTASKALPSGEKVGRVKDTAERNPLGLAVGAAAIGFVAGLAFPSTRVENERMGEMSDRVVEAAKETAGDAVERGKQVAQDAAETAKESGREQGEELASNLQERVQASTGSSSQESTSAY